MTDPVIQDLKAEIQRLKVEVTSTPGASSIPVMKDVTLVTGTKDWTGDSKGRSTRSVQKVSDLGPGKKFSTWVVTIPNPLQSRPLVTPHT